MDETAASNSPQQPSPQQPSYEVLELEKLDERPCPFLGDAEIGDVEVLRPTFSAKIPSAETLGILDPVTIEQFWNSNHAVANANKLLYFTYHYLPEIHEVDFLYPPSTEPGDRQTIIKRNAKKQMLDWQRETGDFIEHGIMETAKIFDHVELQAADADSRQAVWSKIFGRNPYQVTKGMIGIPAKVIALENVFNGDPNEENRGNWHVLLKTMFVWACEDMMEATIVSPNGICSINRKVFYEKWRAMTESQRFLELVPGLWKLKNMPVKAPQQETERTRQRRVISNANREGRVLLLDVDYD